MDCVERVKNICKERKIPISKLEKDLGFSNGYISQLRKGVFPTDRLSQIAEYLGLDPNFLMKGEYGGGNYYLNDETAAIAQEIFENKELRMLFDASRNATPEDLLTVREMMLALKRKESGDND